MMDGESCSFKQKFERAWLQFASAQDSEEYDINDMTLGIIWKPLTYMLIMVSQLSLW